MGPIGSRKSDTAREIYVKHMICTLIFANLMHKQTGTRHISRHRHTHMQTFTHMYDPFPTQFIPISIFVFFGPSISIHRRPLTFLSHFHFRFHPDLVCSFISVFSFSFVSFVCSSGGRAQSLVGEGVGGGGSISRSKSSQV